MAYKKELPVFLFTGFLESGKTKFIQETLEDKRFCSGEKTLLIICEEGFEEYEPDQFVDDSVFLHVIEDKNELNKNSLSALEKESSADRCIIEYNGMWMLDDLYSEMPENWTVYQEFMFADARSFLKYNENMRQLCYDKLKSCELVVFNRYNDAIDRMSLHKIVRGASRRADIAYEYSDGKIEYDDIQDPLPYDLNSDVVLIGDNDFAVWYRDMTEEPDKYEGKVVRFKGRALSRKQVPKGCIIIGRHVMTCCAADIQFAALICECGNCEPVSDNTWIELTAKIHFAVHKAYKRKGPVLSFISMLPCEPPAQEVATFF